MTRGFGLVFLLLAAAWLAQLALSLLQTRRFYRRVAELRRGSHASAIGVAGNNWRRKLYAVLVVDEHYRITAAEKLSGFPVFAGLKPVTALHGLAIERIEDETPVEGIPAKLWSAFANAAEYIRRHRGEADSVVAVAGDGKEARGET